jgi:predicted methyltransferase
MSAWNCLAPGGILLVIAHHTDNLADASAARRTRTCSTATGM